MSTYAFQPARVKKNEEEIKSFLRQLPTKFFKGSGDGWSFLNACVDKDGNQWGEQVNVDELFVLGMAIGKVKALFSRRSWKLLPGGMPYYVVDLGGS